MTFMARLWLFSLSKPEATQKSISQGSVSFSHEESILLDCIWSKVSISTRVLVGSSHMKHDAPPSNKLRHVPNRHQVIQDSPHAHLCFFGHSTFIDFPILQALLVSTVCIIGRLSLVPIGANQTTQPTTSRSLMHRNRVYRYPIIVYLH